MEHPKLPPYDLLEVFWMDTHCSHGWKDPEEFPCEPIGIWSVGYKLEETERGVTLAGTFGADDMEGFTGLGAQCPTFIPKETIKLLTVLRKYNDGAT